MSFKYNSAKKTGFANVFLSLPVQLTTILVLIGIVLYTALLSGYAPVHDTLHELRHSLMFIPCH